MDAICTVKTREILSALRIFDMSRQVLAPAKSPSVQTAGERLKRPSARGTLYRMKRPKAPFFGTFWPDKVPFRPTLLSPRRL